MTDTYQRDHVDRQDEIDHLDLMIEDLNDYKDRIDGKDLIEMRTVAEQLRHWRLERAAAIAWFEIEKDKMKGI